MKARLHRWLAWLTVIMMFVSMVPTSAFATESGGQSFSGLYKGARTLTPGDNIVLNSAEQSLKPYITEITDSTTGESIFTGMSIKMQVGYHIPVEKVFATDGSLYNVWSFTREDLHLSTWDNFSQRGNVYNDNTVIGTYNVVNNKVVIEFNEAFMQQVSTSEGGIVGSITAGGSWDSSVNKDEEKTDLKVGEAGFVVYPNGLGDLSVVKQVESFNTADKTVVWKVTVSSDRGTFSDISLTDTLPNEMNLTGMKVQKQGESAPQDFSNYQQSGNSVSMTLPQLKANEAHVLYFYTKVKDDQSPNWVTNRVTASADDAKGDKDALQDSSEASQELERGTVQKNASYVEVDGKKKVKWVITVNPSAKDISNAKLRDVLNGTGYSLEDVAVYDSFDWNSSTGNPAPSTDYTKNDGTITFNRVNAADGTNKKTYWLVYYTDPTLATNRNDKSFYDKNEVYLDAKRAQTEISLGNVLDMVKKGKSWDATGRNLTYTININPNHMNIAGMHVVDYWQETLPAGVTFVAGSGKITQGASNTACCTIANNTSIDGVIASLNGQIIADTQGDYNCNSYKVVYTLHVDETVTNVPRNDADLKEGEVKVGGDWEEGIGVGVDYVKKDGWADNKNGTIKWTITLNPDKLSITWQNGDALTDTMANHPLASGTQVTVQEEKSGTSNSTTMLSTADFTTVAEVVNWVNANIVKEGTTITSKYTITYYTVIDDMPKVVNNAKIREDEAKKEVWPSLGNIAKDCGGAEPVDNRYRIQWTVSVPVPEYKLSVEAKITDTFTGNHYLNADDLKALKFADLGVKGEDYTISGTGESVVNGVTRYKGFVIDMRKGLPANPDKVVRLTYYTYADAETYSGRMKNTAKLEVGKWSGSASDEMLPGNELTIDKTFTGKLDENNKADSANLRWNISFKVPDGVSGQRIEVVDTLPANVTVTSVSVRVGDERMLSGRLTRDNNWNISDNSNRISVSMNTYSTPQTLTMNIWWQEYAANTPIVITVSAEGTDALFQGNVEEVPIENTATVRINGETATDTEKNWVRKTNLKTPVTKVGEVPQDESIINTANYTVELNRNGLQYLSQPGGKLTVKDTLKWNYKATSLSNHPNAVALKPNSVKLYDENRKEIASSEWSYTTSQRDDGNWAYCDLNLVVPDGKKLILEYTYCVNGQTDNVNASPNLEFINQVELYGEEYEGGSSEDVDVTFTDNSSATATTDGVRFYKVEKGNYNISLANAEFKLYKYENGGFVRVVPKSDGEANAKSGADGRVSGLGKLDSNKVYKLVEVSPPKGYLLNGALELVFSIGEPKGATPSNCNIHVYSLGQAVYIENEPETVDITVNKSWQDDNDASSRPASITYQVVNTTADPSVVVATQTVTAADSWTYTFTGLRKYDKGKPITYIVQELPVPGYSTSGGTLTKVAGSDDEHTGTDRYTTTIVNTELTSVRGTKAWNDANNQDGKRPTSVTIQLQKKVEVDGEETWVDVAGKEATATEPNWTYEFTGLDKYENGQKIEYRTTDTVADYTVEAHGTDANNYELKNKHETEKVDISGTKAWNDANNQDGKRPTSVTIQLQKKVEVDGEETWVDIAGKEATATGPNWTYEFTGLDKYENGQEIEYRTTDTVAYYTVEAPGTDGNNYELKNKHETEKVDIRGTKAWNDANNQDGKRPTSVTIQLQKKVEVDGEETWVDVAGKEATATGPNWTYEFTGLDKYENGQEIEYRTTDTVAYYTVEAPGTDGNNYELKNKHETEKVDISGTKAWNDANNQDGKRPTSVKIQLQKKVEVDGEETWVDIAGKEATATEPNWTYEFTGLDKYENGQEIVYRTIDNVTGYEAEAGTSTNGYELKNSHEPEKITIHGTKAWNDANNQDGKRPTSVTIQLQKKVEVDGEETWVDIAGKEATATEPNWTYEFTGLDKYENGQEIVYRTIDNVTGYEAEAGTSTNGYELKNSHEPEKITIHGTKAWNDASNQDGKRPTSVTIQLQKKVEVDGEETWVDVNSVVAKASEDWTYEFTGLDKYENGQEIVYRTIDNVTGYEAEAGTSTNGYELKNSHEPEKITIHGTKAWNDANNQDGKRPTSVKIQLQKKVEVDGAETWVDIEGKEATATEPNWTYEFTGLDKYEKGQEIVYRTTDTVADYTVEAPGTDGNNYELKNKHETEKVDIRGSKTWEDANDQDGKRPTSITVNLLANGTKVKSQIVTADEQGNWSWTFADMPKYADGKVIKYTVSEVPVAGYTTTYSADGLNIVNSYTPGETGRTVRKIWLDSDDQDGIRPESIMVQLLADGDAYGDPVELNEQNQWTYTWTKLPVNKPVAQEILYTVEEIGEVEGYTTGYSDDTFTITNTHVPATVEVSGSKTWNDANDQDGVRPENITINLLADGEPIDSKTVTEEDGWAWSFTDLPKYKDHGTEIVYTITEEVVEGYETVVNGYDVTNTHVPGTIAVNGIKTWNDANDQDGIRPDSITINLLADGAQIASKTVTEADGWKWSFANLPEFRDQGIAIVYTITEEAVEGYDSNVDGYDVTNTHVPATVEVSGSKAWDDANDQDGIRPENITINLLADGERIDSKTVTEADGWAWSFTNLPKYKDHGTEIVYTITEEVVEGYETVVNGYDVTNTHVPGTIAVNGIKTWNDANDQDGIRPESITINLLADGAQIASKTVTEADGWKWSFANLPEFRDQGIAIVYTITEAAVEGYETVVNGYDVTNTHVPATVEVSGVKTWRDDNDADGIRPRSITVNLLANGEQIESRTVTRADGWSWTFTDLPKYASGVEIVYTITEEPVRGYRTEVNGYDITNRHTPEPTPTITPEPTPVPTPTPTIPEEVKRATRKPVDGAIISTITILDDAVPLFGGQGTGDTMPYAVGGLSLAAILLLVSAYIAKKRSGKHNG